MDKRAPLVIGLTGPKGVGKTTVATSFAMLDAVIGLNAKMSFADPIKAMFTELVRYAEQKNPRPWEYATIEKDATPDWLQGEDVRYALQTLGTEWGRDCFGEGFWVDIMRNRIAKTTAKFVLIDDVRFASEAAMISELDGLVFEITNGDAKYDDSHRSEGEIAGMHTLIHNTKGHPVQAARLIARALDIDPDEQGLIQTLGVDF